MVTMLTYFLHLVKRGTDGKVTALWPGSGLHYVQTLAENRWEDFNWEFHTNRFEYMTHGTSWIEDRDIDRLGYEERLALETTTSMPHADADLTFYLWQSPPLPEKGGSICESAQAGSDSGVELEDADVSEVLAAVEKLQGALI